MPSLGFPAVMRLVTREAGGLRRRYVGPAVRLISLVSLAFAASAAAPPALGRDLDGRNVASQLRDWFEHLASGKGPCGSFADGYVVADANWRTRDGRYQVRLPKAVTSNEMIWVSVPDQAVITAPNKAGRTTVWPLYGSAGVSIRCFMPGSLT